MPVRVIERHFLAALYTSIARHLRGSLYSTVVTVGCQAQGCGIGSQGNFMFLPSAVFILKLRYLSMPAILFFNPNPKVTFVQLTEIP